MKKNYHWALVLIILIIHTYLLVISNIRIKQLEEVTQLIIEVSSAQTKLLIKGTEQFEKAVQLATEVSVVQTKLFTQNGTINDTN